MTEAIAVLIGLATFYGGIAIVTDHMLKRIGVEGE